MINVPVHQQNKEVLQRQQFWSLETSVSSYGYLHLSPLILNTLRQKTYQCFFSKMNFCAVSSFCLSPSGFIHNMSCTHNTENPLPVVWMKSHMKVTPNVFTQWSMILLSWLLLHLSTFFKCPLNWQWYRLLSDSHQFLCFCSHTLTALVWGDPTDPRMSPISHTPTDF